MKRRVRASAKTRKKLEDFFEGRGVSAGERHERVMTASSSESELSGKL